MRRYSMDTNNNTEPTVSVCIGGNLHTVMEWNILCYWIMDIVDERMNIIFSPLKKLEFHP